MRWKTGCAGLGCPKDDSAPSPHRILAADVVGYTLKPLSICWSELCRNWAREAATGRSTIPISIRYATIHVTKGYSNGSIKVKAMKS